jgi:hypothetical protein
MSLLFASTAVPAAQNPPDSQLLRMKLQRSSAGTLCTASHEYACKQHEPKQCG